LKSPKFNSKSGNVVGLAKAGELANWHSVLRLIDSGKPP